MSETRIRQEKPAQRTALLSECGSYRYRLGRIWEPAGPGILFVMLNPSTADAFQDDPTIRRCMGFARSWGFGSFHAGNLFAWRSSKPADLFLTEDPAGKENHLHLEALARDCSRIICAWGNEPVLKKMGVSDGRNLLPPAIRNRELYYLRQSKGGTPWHPLYLPSEVSPCLWTN
jgi:hypothetical protein